MSPVRVWTSGQYNCADLQAHDVQRGHGVERTTNQCPNCAYFSATWSDWSIWDPEDLAAAARCPLCRSACKLAPDVIPQVQNLLTGLDQQLAEATRKHASYCFLAEDLFTLLCFLQEEKGLEGSESEADFERLIRDRESPDLAQQLVQRPMLDLFRRRLSLEEQAARRLTGEQVRWLKCSAESRRAYAQRLVAEFDTPDGFDGVACAGALRSALPRAPVSALEEIGAAQVMAEEEMDEALASLLGQLEQTTEEESHGSLSDGDIPAAIDALNKLLPGAQRFKIAVQRQDFMLAMNAAESLQPVVEGVLRPLVARNEAMGHDLQPLHWEGDRFTEFPDLDAVLRVLQAHIPWQFTPSSVANCVYVGEAPAPFAGAASSSCDGSDRPGVSREVLNREILSFARRIIYSNQTRDSVQDCQVQGLTQQCEELGAHRRSVALLLSTARDQVEDAKSLGRPWQPTTIRGPQTQPHLGRMLRSIILRHARLRRTAHRDTRGDGSTCMQTTEMEDMMRMRDMHEMMMLMEHETRLPEHMLNGMQQRIIRMRDLERRMLRELMQDRELATHHGELETLMREHLMFLMHRVLARGAA